MGFQGFILADVTKSNLKRNRMVGKLSPPEKAANRLIASIRIHIEHAMGRMKRYRIVKGKIWLLKDGFVFHHGKHAVDYIMLAYSVDLVIMHHHKY
jgi:hypothetical protein